MNYKFYISELRVTGVNVSDAQITFSSGLNIVTGPSNTGKSYIYKCIDYIFGSDKIKSPNQFSAYERIYLELTKDDTSKITLLRKINSNKVLLYCKAIDDSIGADPTTSLDVKHDASSNDNISKYILNLIGITDVVPVMSGKTRGTVATLSLRNYLHFFFVDETTIISDQLRIVQKGGFGQTLLESIFRYIITGRDDGKCEEIEKPEIRKARIRGRLEYLSILSQRLVDKQEILQTELADHEHVFSTIDLKKFQQEIENYQGQIDLLTRNLIKYESEYAIEEQELSKDRVLINRFTLLESQYESDLARLKFTADGAYMSHQIKVNYCPLCHTEGIVLDEEKSSQDLELVFTTERDKIQANLAELKPIINDISLRIKPREVKLDSIRKSIDKTNGNITSIIHQKIMPLQELVEKHSERERIKNALVSIGQDIMTIHNDVLAANELLKQKGDEQTYKPTIPTNEESRFCDVMKEILNLWGYLCSSVTLDSGKIDVCIDGEERVSNGKGYRALFYSAFVYAVQQFLALDARPYFPCIVLDSPLTTLRGADKDSKLDTEAVNDNVQDAMLRHIAKLNTVQSIILENKEISTEIEEMCNVIRFTKSKHNGRYGFFPCN